MKIVADLSVSARPHRAREGWHPGWLFRAGLHGAWFDPSDPGSLFQDAAGTIPVTAPGQPVGRMTDKSGAGHHATQANASARPVYRAQGARHWLEFDGVDDFMVLPTALNMAAGTLVTALTEPPETASTRRNPLLSGGAVGYVLIAEGTRLLAKNHGGALRSVDTPSPFAMTAQSAVGVRVTGGTLHARRWPDPQEHVNAIAGSEALSVNTLMAFSPVGQWPARVDLFGMILSTQALAPEDYTRALAHMNGKIAP